MSALLTQTEALDAARATRGTPIAVDSKPLVGPSITINIGVTPGTIALLSAPLSVLVTLSAAYVLLTAFQLPLFKNEMVAAAIVNTLGGMLASVPLFILMQKGAKAIAQAGILAIAIRCGVILMGLIVALAPAWQLARMPLVYWVLGFYFPMLMVETVVIAWLANRAKF